MQNLPFPDDGFDYRDLHRRWIAAWPEMDLYYSQYEEHWADRYLGESADESYSLDIIDDLAPEKPAVTSEPISFRVSVETVCGGVSCG